MSESVMPAAANTPKNTSTTPANFQLMFGVKTTHNANKAATTIAVSTQRKMSLRFEGTVVRRVVDGVG